MLVAIQYFSGFMAVCLALAVIEGWFTNDPNGVMKDQFIAMLISIIIFLGVTCLTLTP